MNCSNCGLQKIKNANYCYGCGFKFVNVPAEPTIMLTADDLEKIVLAAKGLYIPEQKNQSPTESISKNDTILPKGRTVYIPDFPPRKAIICAHLYGDSYSLEYSRYLKYSPGLGIDHRRSTIVNYLRVELGKDVFLSLLEAEYVFENRMAVENDKNKRVREQSSKYEQTVLARPEFIKEPDPTCDACGLPIGIYGHCGCS